MRYCPACPWRILVLLVWLLRFTHPAELLVSLSQQFLRRHLFKFVEGFGEGCAQPPGGLGIVGVGASARLGDDAVNYAQLQRILGSQLECLGGPPQANPQ